jgi:methionine biosynthesis protein MetW
MSENQIQLDYQVITSLVQPGARVLDLGCGDGELLAHLARARAAKVQGVELDEQSIYKCVAKGLSVFHSDIDSGLAGYPDQSFDVVILNESIQQVKKVDYVLEEALRVGRRVIVGFPNFAHYRVRWGLLFNGRSPTTPNLPFQWHNTPNLRFLSISDFHHYCMERGIKVLKAYYLGKKKALHVLPNLRAFNAIFVISNGQIKK